MQFVVETIFFSGYISIFCLTSLYFLTIWKMFQFVFNDDKRLNMSADTTPIEITLTHQKCSK